MRARAVHRVALASSIVLCAALAACGDDDGDTTPRTAEQLAAGLLTPSDLSGTWAAHEAPDEVVVNGVVTDDQQDVLPHMQLCDRARDDAQAALRSLRWKAFTQLDATVDDPVDPPADRSGHIVFVQEFLTSGEVDDITATFDQLQVGMNACLGDFPAEDEGPSTAATMAVPSVGDDRVAVLTTMEEAGGWATWRMHEVLVRDGSTLMGLLVVEVLSNDVEPLYPADAIGTLVDTALAQL